jgi:hypothetical protein
MENRTGPPLQSQTHLLFVWTTAGYELREAQGELPKLGATVERDGRSWRVAKVGPSPLPGDDRLCAYLEG